MTKVFVYGTLKKGFPNHSKMKNSKFISPYTLIGNYKMLNLGGFPGVVQEGTTDIHGEIYEVDDDTLKGLDFFEGHPSFFKRTEVEPGLFCYIYQHNHPDFSNYILDGMWNLNFVGEGVTQ